MSASLSAAMRLGSRAEHEQAEEAPFVTDLLAGRVGAQALDADLDHWLPDGPRTVASPAVTAYRERPGRRPHLRPGRARDLVLRLPGDPEAQAVQGRLPRAARRPRPLPVQTARVVDEVRAAFRLNHGLFAELVDSLPA